MADFVLFIACGVGFYGIMTFAVAATGPHHPAERAEYECYKHEKRRSNNAKRDL